MTTLVFLRLYAEKEISKKIITGLEKAIKKAGLSKDYSNIQKDNNRQASIYFETDAHLGTLPYFEIHADKGEGVYFVYGGSDHPCSTKDETKKEIRRVVEEVLGCIYFTK